MKFLSVQQPWAWLIVAGHKDIENRGYRTNYRGPILIHASGRYALSDYACDWHYFQKKYDVLIPEYDDLARGAIIGAVMITDCVAAHASPWKMNDGFGYVLSGAVQINPIPYKGALQIRDLDHHQLTPEQLAECERAIASIASSGVPDRTTAS